ncbi:MAG: hypothetical protein MMC33_008676 [Icmadophila ericetorum]|nr:hypothetical protein [Icmadophila ericetorum]
MYIASTCRRLRLHPWQSSKVNSFKYQGPREPQATQSFPQSAIKVRWLQTGSSEIQHVPFRKQLKDAAKRRREAGENGENKRSKIAAGQLEQWELTVGIEVHAQLNTERKLFSRATTSINDEPNSHVALFDMAFPGSQPIFQKATLLPALRAAVALNCNIQRISKFDRKHYFYQDQPSGYQITQYYEPFAKDGHITLYDHDGIAPEDGESITIGIKQIQMEQDTAKTIQQSPETMLLDFNRVGHPLIEIITLPQIHHPSTAAACVRKIQSLLQAVNAVTTGMEMGGLRADVNVSVRLRNATPGTHAYYGVTGLGQRIEIKNLSSFKAVEDAVVAERDRQIQVLESGGQIEGETRGWTLGSTETKRLRGKEGEVDYRYMPDPDVPPVIIGKSLIDHITSTLPILPDQQINRLISEHSLTLKDAKTLVALEDGERLDYFDIVVSQLSATLGPSKQSKISYGKTAANWIIHELGGHLSNPTNPLPFSSNPISPSTLSTLLIHLLTQKITNASAKSILALFFTRDPLATRTIPTIIKDLGLEISQSLTDAEYGALAQRVVEENEEMATKVREDLRKGRNKNADGKIKWFVGMCVRGGGGKVVPTRAKKAVQKVLGVDTEVEGEER